jgi:5'/3'-nucleotidase
MDAGESAGVSDRAAASPFFAHHSASGGARSGRKTQQREDTPSPVPKIANVRVLLTNDDGISAPGLQAARRALRELDDVDVDVIAPDSNRSATARSITTRSPLTVEEVEFGDGDRGFATGGTPVDCVRFAELGLVGHRPDLIVSGINHGANLGDDITYSGTVAAAFEGIVLGIPAVAISQQSSGGGMGYVSGRFDFAVAAPFLAQLVTTLIAEPMPSETLINVNCPAGEPSGIEVTKLGKRLYNDELKLVSEDEDGRRHYEIYGWQPGFEELEGTDLTAISQGRIAVTPIHFDLTDHGGLERLRGWRFEEMLAASFPSSV